MSAFRPTSSASCFSARRADDFNQLRAKKLLQSPTSTPSRLSESAGAGVVVRTSDGVLAMGSATHRVAAAGIAGEDGGVRLVSIVSGNQLTRTAARRGSKSLGALLALW